MKKLLILAFAVLSFTSVSAQEGEDVGWVARFGAAGGFTPAMVFPNLDPINAQIKNMGIGTLSSSGMMIYGGSGYAYIMLIDNLRIGGMGLGGTKSTSGTVGGLSREVKYNFSFAGLTVEYTLPFIKNIAVSVGTIIGMGSNGVEGYQNQGSYSWTDIWKKVSGASSSNQVSDRITNSFYTITPTLNIDIPLDRFIAFRFGAGYVTSIGSQWKLNNDQNISGVPSDLNNNSFFIQTGIFVGLIAF
ncbi:MAG: hypothetical protein CVV24_01455 [Ignavibacteriae bacterium HGW-Ignavibacteriae-3]|nr:MAG: hypothetical protein CVV24_01455 [Ignavibacteriae bacterium HGW-Ignavibacteriae-3]